MIIRIRIETEEKENLRRSPTDLTVVPQRLAPGANARLPDSATEI